jgi:hypothetical protein
MLPMKMPKLLIKAEAEPESPFCCSSIRLAPGVRTQLALIVAGSNKIAEKPWFEIAQVTDQCSAQRNSSKTSEDNRSCVYIS